jgi:H+/Cl- antiporter ClcA
MSERGAQEDASYKDIENPLHNETGSSNDYRPPSLTGKALLDGEIQQRDSVETKKREKAPSDLSGYYAVILMFMVGCFSGVLVNVVQWGMSMLSLMQAKLIMSNAAGGFCFMLTSTTLCGLAAFVCKKSGRVAVLGSGIPEVKALLANDFHPSELAMVVSSRIGFTRMFALVMSLGSGLSVGSAAPLVHMTVCNAYTFMKLSPDFGCLLENTAMMRQIFNASAAAGMAACFNCPLGGVLFSIEVTSSFYIMANYWRSFMAAVAGAVLFSMILWWRGIDDSRPWPLDYVADPWHHWEIPLFLVLGLVGGGCAFAYLKLQQMWFLTVRKLNVTYPIAFAACVGAFNALMIYAVGSYTLKGITCGNIVNDLLHTGAASELQRYDADPLGWYSIEPLAWLCELLWLACLCVIVFRALLSLARQYSGPPIQTVIRVDSVHSGVVCASHVLSPS